MRHFAARFLQILSQLFALQADLLAWLAQRLVTQPADAPSAAESTSAPTTQPQPPAHWEAATRSRPPAHWLNKVRQGAPQLLDPSLDLGPTRPPANRHATNRPIAPQQATESAVGTSRAEEQLAQSRKTMTSSRPTSEQQRPKQVEPPHQHHPKSVEPPHRHHSKQVEPPHRHHPKRVEPPHHQPHRLSFRFAEPPQTATPNQGNTSSSAGDTSRQPHPIVAHQATSATETVTPTVAVAQSQPASVRERADGTSRNSSEFAPPPTDSAWVEAALQQATDAPIQPNARPNLPTFAPDWAEANVANSAERRPAAHPTLPSPPPSAAEKAPQSSNATASTSLWPTLPTLQWAQSKTSASGRASSTTRNQQLDEEQRGTEWNVSSF